MNFKVATTALVVSFLAFGAQAHESKSTNSPAKTAKPAHGHGESVGKPGDPKKVSRTIEVVMNDQMRFLPADIVVQRGETIRFLIKNIGEMPHEMVIGTESELREHAQLMQKFPEMEHDEPNGAAVEPGKTGEIVWQFTRGGRFDFACLKPGHFEAGMVGEVEVQVNGRRVANRPGNGAPTTAKP